MQIRNRFHPGMGIQKVMSKISMMTLCAFLLTAGTVVRADSDILKTGNLYQAVFAADYRDVHSMDSDNQYVIKIDAISKANPNWILVEFPQPANQSFNSSFAGKRWINLNYVMELLPYAAPGQ